MKRLIGVCFVLSCSGTVQIPFRGTDAGVPDSGTIDAGVFDGGRPDGGSPDSGVVATNTDPCLPFAMPPTQTLFGSQKKVLAHYFAPFPIEIGNVDAGDDYYNVNYLSPQGEHDKWLPNGGFLRQRPLPVSIGSPGTYVIDNMKREIALAIREGITGFTFDVLSTDQVASGSALQNLLTAASAADARFKIVVMPDLTSLGTTPTVQTYIEDLIVSVASSSAAYTLADGRLVVSSFNASLAPASFWQTIFTNVASRGVQVAFVPTFLGWQGHITDFGPISYGLSDWGTATPASSASSQAWPPIAHDGGYIFMMPVDPQQYRPKDFLYWEAGNSLAFRNAWTSAIDGGSDWVQLVTWSDFSESSEIEPYTDATLAPDLGTGFFSLNAFYASWFLTGQAPQINEDALFFFYRREPTTAAAPAQTSPTTLSAGGGTPSNNVELLAFLTAPATMTITLNGQRFAKNAPAGITSFTVPLQTGTPHFGLERNDAGVISFDGPIEIVGDAGLPSGTLDLTYWSGSASSAGTCKLYVP